MDASGAAVMRLTSWRWVLVLLVALPCAAHVGAPDIYMKTTAGPYPVTVVIRPPEVIPGVATVELDSLSGEIASVKASPLPVVGEAAKHPPVPDVLTPVPGDPRRFQGRLWLMASGSWQVRFFVEGKSGAAILAVPVPAVAHRTKGMNAAMGWMLSAFGVFLFAGVIAIAGASAREANLAPGKTASRDDRKRGLRVMAGAFVILSAVIVGGANWWRWEAQDYSDIVYKPLQMTGTVQDGVLTLSVSDPGWFKERRLDDLIPDHGHLMHLYALRMPDMDVVYHLHPEEVEAGEFRQELPDMPGGEYKLFADVVHASGFPETLTMQTALPTVLKHSLKGDDAGGEVTPLAAGSDADSYLLPDGFRMQFVRPAEMKPRTPLALRFQLLDQEGKPAQDVVPYMGMGGHAAIVKDDATVFAHIHPEGSVNMAALMLAQRAAGAEHQHTMEQSSEVDFPFGFPSAGDYRIIVQMKRGAQVETAVFDAAVRD